VRNEADGKMGNVTIKPDLGRSVRNEANLPSETKPMGQWGGFDALRASYVSNLVASGAPVKDCQMLARHSSPALTIGVHAEASVHDIRGAVDALRDPAAAGAAPEAVAATGTGGRHISKRFVRRRGRFGAVTCGSGVTEGDEPNPIARRVLSLAGGVSREEAPGGFEPPVEVLQTSALPLGYGAPRDEWEILTDWIRSSQGTLRLGGNAPSDRPGKFLSP
jgi:hypothetical protein